MYVNYKKYIKKISDWPKPGVLFYDITSLIANGDVYKQLVVELSEIVKKYQPDVLICPEARGFIIGCPVATYLNIGFVPARKHNKLPREVISSNATLEYGEETFYLHKNDLNSKQRIVIVDDILASCGTIKCLIKMVNQLGCKVEAVVAMAAIKKLCPLEFLNQPNIKYIFDF